MSLFLQEHKSLPVQIRSIPTQRTLACALMNLRKVQENENLVSESWLCCYGYNSVHQVQLKTYIEATDFDLNSTMIVQTVSKFSDWDGRIHDCLFTSSGTWRQSRNATDERQCPWCHWSCNQEASRIGLVDSFIAVKINNMLLCACNIYACMNKHVFVDNASLGFNVKTPPELGKLECARLLQVEWSHIQ